MNYLPIDAAIPDIISALSEQPNLVIEAAPGTGKTTRVPPAILNSKISNDKEVWVLEPRRLAARLSARRVADELNEKLGETVGYQIRFEDVSSARTKLRFLTEGLLTRKLLTDPHLKNVSVAILDEFHERNLYTDIALALLRQLQNTSRPDLKIVVMSATLDAQPIAKYLGNCKIVQVEGKRFPIALEYQTALDSLQIAERVLLASKSLITKGHQGDILVFLSGAAEIRRSFSACENFASQQNLQLGMLHGELSAAEQDAVLQSNGKQKIIFSTNVAETSLTIEGVTAVIDSGLAKVSGHSTWSGLPTLTTQRISKASAIQRAGRAGRTAPGKCIRLYSEMDFSVRPDFETPEIMRSDLAATILQLAGAGVSDPLSFAWFETPAVEAIASAQNLLRSLEAIDERGRITSHGEQLLTFPLHPRQAKIFIAATELGVEKLGAILVALLSERTIHNFSNSARKTEQPKLPTPPENLLAQVETISKFAADKIDVEALRVKNININAARQILKTKQQLLNISKNRLHANDAQKIAPENMGVEEKLCLATLNGYPDRVGVLQASDNVVVGRGRDFSVQMCNDQFAVVPSQLISPSEKFVVVLDVSEQRAGGSGRTSNLVIRSLLPIKADWLLDLFPENIAENFRVVWNEKSERVEAYATINYGALILDDTRIDLAKNKMSDSLAGLVQQTLQQAINKTGWQKFIAEDELAQLKARINFGAKYAPEIFPQQLTFEAVNAGLYQLCVGCSSFAGLREAINLSALTYALLSASQVQKLAEIAPEFIALPGRKKVRVHYDEQKEPWIESRMQDFFGLNQTPAIAHGRVLLVLHLLAPNNRAQQVTNDLAGFWTRTYPQLRRELSRRYPRHQWPENPLQKAAQNKL